MCRVFGVDTGGAIIRDGHWKFGCVSQNNMKYLIPKISFILQVCPKGRMKSDCCARLFPAVVTVSGDLIVGCQIRINRGFAVTPRRVTGP